ncbi:hypothetical protein [Undibacterium sp. Ren11W]|uniref:hypothetical protein n=1 Tax=Undibacterium sp. Ren11W TaxID=3413045 RepID=UPI003BEF8001
MKFYLLFVLTLISMLTGCATVEPSRPKDYVGPIATVNDSATRISKSKVDLFFTKIVDGRKIENAQAATSFQNQGKGFSVEPYLYSHEIPARPSKLIIKGSTQYAAPILAMTNPVYVVEGEIEFAPEENKQYTVRGKLSAEGSAVWIEETTTGKLVGQKVESIVKK